MRSGSGWTAGLVLFGVLVLAAPAYAGWPGLNGRLSFTSNRETGTTRGDIFTAFQDGSDQRLLFIDTRNDAQSSWSPDGLRVAWRARRFVSEDMHTIGWHGLGEQPVAFDRAYDESQPSWAPDGRSIVFRRNLRTQVPNLADIWEIDADGTNLRPVLVTPFDEGYPSYSPDGTQLLFRNDASGNDDVYVMDVATREITRLTDHPGIDTGPAWSPDGTQISFDSDRGGSDDVYVMNADGTDVVRLTDSPASDRGGAWAPDGTKLAFTSERTGDSEIFVMNADGSAQHNVSNAPGRDESPDWQPIPHAAGDWTACGDAVTSGPGAYSIKAERAPCDIALRIASRWTQDDRPGSRADRVEGFDCPDEQATFGHLVVSCEHRGAQKRVIFVHRPSQ